MFLLAEEDNHISKFRARVEKEKTRIEKDVQLVRTEIDNLLEDLKIQMCTYIDDHYKRYISVYGAFKEEIIQFKQQKL
jgi:recombinational DNA repair protein (RecF pathway)